MEKILEDVEYVLMREESSKNMIWLCAENALEKEPQLSVLQSTDDLSNFHK